MDPELIIYMVLVVIWFLSRVVGQLKKITANRPRREAPKEGWRGDESPLPVDRGRDEGRSTPTPLARGSRSPSYPPPPQPAPSQPTPEETLRELFRRMGGEVEVLQPVDMPAEMPVESEHVPTRGEHSQSPWEWQGTVGEHSHTASEHVHRPSDLLATPSEHRMTLGEHRGTLSEHMPGDVVGPITRSSAAFASKTTHRRKTSRVGRQVRRDLRHGGPALARAVVLEQILGPPRSLKAYGQGEER